MARSTRNLIKYHADAAINMLGNSLGHLQSIDELAEGHSEPITKYLPLIVQMYDELEKLLKRFSELL